MATADGINQESLYLFPKSQTRSESVGKAQWFYWLIFIDQRNVNKNKSHYLANKYNQLLLSYSDREYLRQVSIYNP